MRPNLLYGRKESRRQLGKYWRPHLNYFDFLSLFAQGSLARPLREEFPDATFLSPPVETEWETMATLTGLVSGRQLIITLSHREKKILLDYQSSYQLTPQTTSAAELLATLARLLDDEVDIEIRSMSPATLEELLDHYPSSWHLSQDDRDTLTAFSELTLLSPLDSQVLAEVDNLGDLNQEQRRALLSANQFVPIYLSRPLAELR